jgi:FKBP-type peptidyl-prolyl cis-trans isomerase 2
MKLLPLLACLVLLAGCLGYPPGAIRPGDDAVVRYTATDPLSGQVLVPSDPATSTAGKASGLGPDIDRALVGHLANDTFSLDATAPARYTGSQAVSADLGRSPLQSQVPVAAFQAQLGPPHVGQEFRASALYNATVVDASGGNVTYRLKVADGQEIPVPSLGLKVVHRIDGTQLVRSLAPLPGTTFGVEPSATGQTPLGLPPGSYRSRSLEDGRLTFDYSPVLPAFFGRTLHFDVTVLAVHPNVAPPAPSGEYGHRASPQLLGDPAAAPLNITVGQH